MVVTINIQNESVASHVPEAALLQLWARTAITDVKRPTEVTIRIVDEEEGRALNKTWRNKDYATNVLSFYMGEAAADNTELLGDIVICAPVVGREALHQGKDAVAHWAHLVIHGVLHLRGYDHENASDAEVMEKMEITLLDKIGYANPYEIGPES